MVPRAYLPLTIILFLGCETRTMPFETEKAGDNHAKEIVKRTSKSTFGESFETDMAKRADGDGAIPVALEKRHVLEESASGRTKRAWVVKNKKYQWPDGVVPYKFAQLPKYNKKEIVAAMNEISRHSCINFRQASKTDKHMVIFNMSTDCYAYVGRQPKAQLLYTAPKCGQRGVVIHNLLHTLGFWNEESRFDRDRYVIINFANLNPGALRKFQIMPGKSYGTHYDYLSITHSGPQKNPSTGLRSIKVKDQRYSSLIGQRTGMSFGDIKALNLMYNCAGKNKCPNVNCFGDGFVDKSCQCICQKRNINLKAPTQKCEQPAWKRSGSSLYTVVQCPKDMACNFDLAKKDCKSMGGRLAPVLGDDVIDIIWELTVKKPGVSFLMVDGTRGNPEWVYSDGKEMTYAKWSKDHPNARPPGCTVVSNFNRWYRLKCDSKLGVSSGYVCQKTASA